MKKCWLVLQPWSQLPHMGAVVVRLEVCTSCDIMTMVDMECFHLMISSMFHSILLFYFVGSV